MISAILTCNTTTLTANHRRALAERAQWVVLNTRNGRALIDIIGERADLQWIIDKLTLAGLAPIVCAAWEADGLVFPFSQAQVTNALSKCTVDAGANDTEEPLPQDPFAVIAAAGLKTISTPAPP